MESGLAAGEQDLAGADARFGMNPAALSDEARRWLELRLSRSAASEARFHGGAQPFVPPTYAISALERYLRCPFLFFAERVLKVEEDPSEERTLSAKDQGIFVHQVFERFFGVWQSRGYGAITLENIADARAIFHEVLEKELGGLPEDEASVQRARLLGSPADEGLAETVFQIELGWTQPVVERFLEHPLEGEFEIQSEAGPRRIGLRGKADRIDVLADGTLRIVDYKLGSAPDRRQALQLPIYSDVRRAALRTAGAA